MMTFVCLHSDGELTRQTAAVRILLFSTLQIVTLLTQLAGLLWCPFWCVHSPVMLPNSWSVDVASPLSSYLGAAEILCMLVGSLCWSQQVVALHSVQRPEVY